MLLRAFFVGALASLALSGGASAQSQFHVFPVGILEGVADGAVNPALQRSLVAALKDPGERPDIALINRFREAVRRSFPQSTVHPRQVREAGSGGAYEYQGEGSGCDARFHAPISSSYAMVLSVTRASVYRNERAGQVDYQIPVTLTLQIIKPEKGKVAFTLSDTLYSPFIFAKQEADLPATRALMNRKVIENMLTQVEFLVSEAAKSFNPKASVVKVLGKSGKYLVLDGGYEVGFTKGDEPSAARVDKPDSELFFKVIAAGSGHSIVRLQQGDLEVGTELKFVFESAADDSQKPGLLPVTRFDQFGEQFDDQVAIAQQFVKNLGFSSRFNIVPVNTNFKSTMSLIKAEVFCGVDWSKFPGSSDVKESRTDLPRFFAQFELARSEIYRNEGTRGVQGVSTESEEEFAIATAVRLVDSKMRVHYSEAVVEPYKIKRVNGRGMTTRSGLDVAIKNSVLKLATSFAKNAKLEVRDLQVSRAEGNRLWVPASGLNPADISAFTVFRELDISFKGQKVWMPLELGDGTEPKAALEGSEIVLSFSRITNDTPLPRRGDRVRFEGLAKPGAVSLQRCAMPDYFSDRTAYEPKFTNMFIEAAINASPRLQLVETGDAFFDVATRMLDVGNFKLGALQKQAPPAMCYQAGAAVRPDALKCETGRCKATVVNGLIARFGSTAGGAPTQQVQAAQQTEVSNFLEPEAKQFLGFQSMLWFDGLQGELKKRLQSFSLK